MIPFDIELVRNAICAFGLTFACQTADANEVGPGLLVNGQELPFSTWHTTVMPGEALRWQAPTNVKVEVNGQQVKNWRAPGKAGTHTLEFVRGSSTIATVTVFVLEPATNIDSKGALNGYKIGTYPRSRPKGFIRLDSVDDYDTAMSPSFRVGQFICKQQPNHFPKYVLVSKPNLKRTEALLKSLRDDGLTDANTFFVMSGFRTPFYNTAIGSAKFSRHMYGDAFDIYLDVDPKDGVMDDINQDGRVTKADANFLYDYAADLFAERDDLPKGGIGAYGSNAVHGPFVHVDGRGSFARWGR